MEIAFFEIILHLDTKIYIVICVSKNCCNYSVDELIKRSHFDVLETVAHD